MTATADGYLAAHLVATPEFDTAKAQVHYRWKISEGAISHGNFYCTSGVTEILANKLKTRRLRTGQIYDASYENLR